MCLVVCEHVVVRGELGAFDAELVAVGRAALAIDLDRRVEDGLADSVEVLKMLMEVPGVVVEPVHVHVDRAGFEKLAGWAEALAQSLPAAHEALVRAR